ncbi:MAG: hypothetical protein ACRDZ4_14490 [Egibacteraceae bacterium]
MREGWFGALEHADTSRGKLVRDKIPQILRSRGLDPLVRVADCREYRDLLRAKLSEEGRRRRAARSTAGNKSCRMRRVRRADRLARQP